MPCSPRVAEELTEKEDNLKMSSLEDLNVENIFNVLKNTAWEGFLLHVFSMYINHVISDC